MGPVLIRVPKALWGWGASPRKDTKVLAALEAEGARAGDAEKEFDGVPKGDEPKGEVPGDPGGV